MTTEATIKSQIENTVGGHYSDWKIGLTDNPKERKAQLGNPLNWLHWKTDSERTSQNIESFFLKKGMLSAGGSKKSATYVYILPAQ